MTRPKSFRLFTNGTMTFTMLLTGFGSFPGAPYNPAGPLVAKLARFRDPRSPACGEFRCLPDELRRGGPRIA